MRKEITYESEYHSLPIMTDREKKLGCYKHILSKTEKLMTDMIERHSKVLFFRFDVSLPQNLNSDNGLFKRFNAEFNRTLKKQGLDPHYLAVREVSSNKGVHHHEVMLLDGNKTQSAEKHFKTAERIIEKLTNDSENQGHLHKCRKDRQGNSQKNEVMLCKGAPDFQENFDTCFRRASYLAKVNQKNSGPEGQRTLFSSKL